MSTTQLEIHPSTGADWPAVDALFGRSGASNGCWCQYWLLGADYHRRDRELNRRALAAQMCDAQAGLIAYRDGDPVGWARLSRRSEHRWLLARFPHHEFGPGDPWAMSCFFVKPTARGTGDMAALIEFAAAWAGDRNETVEAYPIDPSVPDATANRYTGLLQTFLDAGFRETGRLSPYQVVVSKVAP